MAETKVDGIMGPTVVPFGKYKGQPVETMLSDVEYMAWLESQPWFRERFSYLMTAKDQEKSHATPVHNRMQAAFVDEDYVIAFMKVLIPGWFAHNRVLGEKVQKAIAELESELDTEKMKFEETLKNKAGKIGDEWIKWEEGLYVGRCDKIKSNIDRMISVFDKILFDGDEAVYTGGSTFEWKGADVVVGVRKTYKVFSYSKDEIYYGNDSVELEYMVEIKPVVGDDYPAVLRQMNRNKTDYLFLGEYSGEGATRDQFIEIFRRAGKIVVFKSDVDAIFAFRGKGRS